MITASEPLEFIPRGRYAADEHPGPLTKKPEQQHCTSEQILLNRIQNVNISDEVTAEHSEFWQIQEIVRPINHLPSNGDQFLIEPLVNSEEELYVKGSVAVWCTGSYDPDNNRYLPRKCFTCDTTISHAFFCGGKFLRTADQTDDIDPKGICLIDSDSLHVYCDTGENYLTNIEFPISKVWQTEFGCLFEKEATNIVVNDHQIPLPRLYSLSHPLDEMSPVLYKSPLGIVSYLIEAEYTVIFASCDNNLVLLFDNKLGKHFVSKLRPATKIETDVVSVTGNNDSMAGTLNHTFGVGLNSLHHPNPYPGRLFTEPGNTSLPANRTNATGTPHSSTFMRLNQLSQINRPQHFHSPMDLLHSSMDSGHIPSIVEMRKVEMNEQSKPIVPKLCLEHVWMETLPGKEYNEIASSGFMHTDLINQSYMCYITIRCRTLNFLRLEKSNTGEYQIIGRTQTITVKDAIPLRTLKMIAALDTNGILLLYSGPFLIGKVHIGGVLSSNLIPSNPPSGSSTSFHLSASQFPKRSSLLPTSHVDADFDDGVHMLSPVHPLPQFPHKSKGVCMGLRDSAGNRLTLYYPGGKMYRISIPFISECPFIIRCLIALRQILPKDLAIQLLSKWYGTRNAPGSKNLSTGQEWKAFSNVLLEFVGRPVQIPDDGTAPNRQFDEQKKRRKIEQYEGSNDDWEFLCKFLNPLHRSDLLSSPDEMFTHQRNDVTAPLFPYIPIIFYSLHLLYENMKLDGLMALNLELLAKFLYNLAIDLELDGYCLHYFLDYPHLAYERIQCFVTETERKRLMNLNLLTEPIPNIFKYINGVIKGMDVGSYPFIRNVNEISKKIVEICWLICHGTTASNKTIKIMIPDDGTNINTTSEIPAKQSTDPICKQVVNLLIKFGITRSDIEQLPIGVRYLITEALEHSRHEVPVEYGKKAYELLLRPELLAHTIQDSLVKYRNVHQEHSLSPRQPYNPDIIPKPDTVTSIEDGMEHMDTKLLSLRFQHDLRINEVRTCLASSRPVTIDIVQASGVSDHDFIEEQEKQLYAISIRTMSLPMGRGMFTLRTCNPMTTESLHIPKLCLTGREHLKGATVDLLQIDVPVNMNMWPSFHNGVAAGLQISPDAKDIDSTWIVYNKPKGQNEVATEHAGFLMALGLNGHLRTLSFLSIYEYLVKCDEMTSVGLLLGISAAHRATQHTTATKLLSVHIEALLPATALELDIPQNIQVAALMGIGLVYQGTAKRHITEVLLQEIGRPPGPEMENCIERESYALTAGLSLGLVTLGQGDLSTGIRDLQLPDTLNYYMIGGNRRPLTGAQKEKYKLPSFQVREGDTVNIDVTGPGATLALGLMFFNTGNEAVAHWMKPPDTHYLLDLVRPDLLLLRILARGLILWERIEPTKHWLYGQFPKSLAFDLKIGPAPTDLGSIDDEAICQAFCNIITGAALCIGLRYAGTENPIAYDTLLYLMDSFLNMGGQYIGAYAGKATIETCLILTVIAISLVFAGSGNLEILRYCRMLRSRLGAQNSHVSYGSHMAIHMAMGFLFLGAGRYTLSRSPQAIAALLCALFPKFPTHSNDNRYHLQAFRHLYVLAIEPRIFLPRDIDSGKLTLCNVTVITLTNDVIVLPMAPCMLPELDCIKSVVVDDPNYWPIRFERGKNLDQLISIILKCGCIDIKQKAGCLSYLDDPDRLKGLLSQTLTTDQYKCWKLDPEIFPSFSKEANVRQFFDKFLRNPVTSNRIPSNDESETQQLLTLQFYDCLTKDQLHAFTIYMNLLNMLREIRIETKTMSIWQFKIIENIINRHKSCKLLSTELLRSMYQRLLLQIDDMWMNDNSDDGNPKRFINQYLFSSNISFMRNCPLATLKKCAALIIFYDLPINVMNFVDLSNGQLNYMKMLIEFKRLNYETDTINFISKILARN